MFELTQNPQTIGQVIKTWIEASKKTFNKVLPYTLFMIPINLVNAFFNESTILANTKLAKFFIVFSLQIVAIFAMTCMIYKVISVLLEKKDFSFTEIAKVAEKRVFPIVGLVLIWLALLSPILIIAFIDPLFPSLTLLIAVPYYLFIAVKLYLSFFIICFPGKGIWEAMDESIKLVQGNFWRVALFIATIFFIIFTFLAMILIMQFWLVHISGFETVNSTGQGETISALSHRLIAILLPILSAFVYQLATVFGVVVLNDLRQRKGTKTEKDNFIMA